MGTGPRRLDAMQFTMPHRKAKATAQSAPALETRWVSPFQGSCWLGLVPGPLGRAIDLRAFGALAGASAAAALGNHRALRCNSTLAMKPNQGHRLHGA
jgi:hypothetical protein